MFTIRLQHVVQSPSGPSNLDYRYNSHPHLDERTPMHVLCVTAVGNLPCNRSSLVNHQGVQNANYSNCNLTAPQMVQQNMELHLEWRFKHIMMVVVG